MSQTPSPAPIDVTPDALKPVQEFYRQGLCVQAYQASQAIGPFAAWRGTVARLIAGRLAYNLGAPRLAHGLHLTAWRADRADPEACYFYARLRFERRGPLPTWKFLRKVGDLPDTPAETRADWFAFHACLLGWLRDFDAAEDWLARAEKICPDRPWICLERSHLFELEDRYDDAIAAARHSLQLRPWYRPGIQALAHLLQLVDRDTEALELLTEADRKIESGPAARQLAELQRELHRYADARKSYERYRELSPLLEKELEKFLTIRQASIAYLCGDDSQAAELARQVDEPICKSFADRLEQTRPDERRKELEVGFVRQHHYTCAPATLATISRFWKRPTDHLDIAADICYNGTPDSRERRWADEHGWIAREFTVTWDTACALIDRGLPFTLTTVDIPYGHAQAVIGYDRCWQTLLVRDPYIRSMLEFPAEATLTRYRSTGPRGLVLVPSERADLLNGVDLPDAAVYDQLYQLQRALADFDRDRAATVHGKMQADAPTHRLTLWAGCVLAGYDADPVGMLTAVERLLEQFPDDAPLQLYKLHCLRTLARRDERLTMLAAICAKKESHPYFWHMYAQELAGDAREHPNAVRQLRRLLRVRPVDPNAFGTLAGILRVQRRLAESLELDRFAACVDDKNEATAQNYFISARLLRQTEKAMAWLQKRCDRFADRSNLPVRTLFWAYQACERAPEGFAVLDAQLMLRPSDGELKLFAAQSQAEHGNYDRAEYLLKGADGHCPRTAWLRTAAHVAHGKGDLAGSLGLWRQVLAAEPMAFDVHRSIAQLLAETENRAAALAHLRGVCERFPFNYPLRQLQIEWLREEGPHVVEPAVRELIALQPADAWAHRELALALSTLGRHDEAQAEAELGRQLEPFNSTTFSVLGQVSEQAGRREAAREAFREAIRLAVDNTFAINLLMAGCDTFEQRRESLAFIESELVRQVIFGDGLWAWQFHAQQIMQPVELLQSLQRAHDARPDLWQAWSAVVRQLLDMRRSDEALTLARQATSRFPLLPRLWLDLAAAARAVRDREVQRHAIGQALLINPGWGPALRQQAELHSDTGDFAQARAVLEDAIRRAPLDPYNYGPLAEALWQMGEREAALERVQKAVEMEPGYEWAWRAMRDWSRLLRKPDIAATAARRLTAARPSEARSWLILAETLEGPAHASERLDALNRVLTLNPRSATAADLKAEHLALAGQHAEALAVCTHEAFGAPLPLVLRGRAAWIEAQRGDHYKAIEQMHALLVEDPKYYWGWQNLTEWYKQINATAGYLESADRLVQAAPDSPLALCHRGKARLASGDRRGAKADFRRAVEISPSSRDATGALFEAQLDDKEFEAAARTLTLMKGHHYDDVTVAREIQLLSRTREQSRAVDFFRQMTVGSKAPSEALSIGARALVSAGCAAELDQVLEQALQSPDTNPAVGEVWVDRWVARGQWGLVDRLRQRLDAMVSKGEVGQRAIDALGRKAKELDQPNLRKLLERVLERYQPKVRTD